MHWYNRIKIRNIIPLNDTYKKRTLYFNHYLKGKLSVEESRKRQNWVIETIISGKYKGKDTGDMAVEMMEIFDKDCDIWGMKKWGPCLTFIDILYTEFFDKEPEEIL